VALVLQLTVIDRLPLPGGAPDLVLLVVVALGLTGGPVAGMLTGFWAGLALDVAPPAGYLVGEHALVFCLVGYGCGRLSGITDRSAASSLGIAAMAAAGGEVLQVIVGLMFGDPGVSWPAIRIVLPSAVLQDILISPFVVYLMMRASGWASDHRLGSPAARGTSPGLLPGLLGAGRGGLADGAVPGAPGGTRWLAGSPGSGGGLKPGVLGAVRFGNYAARQGDGWVGSGPRSWRAVRSQVRGRQPRLRPGAGQAGSATAGQVHRRRPASPVSIRMGSGRRGGRSVGNAFAGGMPGQQALGGAGGRPGRHPRFRPGGGRSPGGLSSAGPASTGLGSAGQRGAGLGSTGLGSTGLGSVGPRGAGLGRAGLRGAGLGRGAVRGGAGRGGTWRGATLRGNGRGTAGLRGAGLRGAGRSGTGRSGTGPRGAGLGSGWRRGAGFGRGSFGRGSFGRGSFGRGISGGGLAGGSASRPAFRPASRRLAPRFRGRAAAGASWASRQPRLRIGRRSFLARMTSRKAAGRPAWWRLGRRRTGGFP
jgi:rod shape-determining protein MreD